MADADARLASVLRLLLNEYDIYDVDDLAANIGGVQGDVLAAWLKSDACRDAAAVEQAAASMAADAAMAVQVQLMREKL